AADKIDVVLARARGGEQRVAAPNRKGDDFRATVAQLSGDFGEEPIVAHHHAQFAEARVEHGVFFAGRDAAFDFTAGQSGFAIFALNFSIRTDEHGDVVDE